MGSPPRARGTRIPARDQGRGSRITPACAGNTWLDFFGPPETGDHPRVRGEHPESNFPNSASRGSPPRARGTHTGRGAPARVRRITPACAGNTTRMTPIRISSADHPRVRGEHASDRQTTPSLYGSPPRARGTRGGKRPLRLSRRITPACAGNTARSGSSTWATADHPRVRGEHRSSPSRTSAGNGSPPRARGTRAPERGSDDRVRITPACAGNTLPDLGLYRAVPQFSCNFAEDCM